jgi:two-component system OmpR family response regulator
MTDLLDHPAQDALEALRTVCCGRHALILEDDPLTAVRGRDGLLAIGFTEVDVVTEGERAVQAASRKCYDVILLDRMNPGLDGLEVLARIRALPDRPDRSTRAPILMLTALGGDRNRIEGLLRGADDYVPKPISMAELQARVAAQVRRTTWTAPRGAASSLLSNGPLVIDTLAPSVALGSIAIHLPPRSLGVLIELTRFAGQPVSKTMLWDRAWSDWASQPDEWQDTIDVAVRRVRRSLDDAEQAVLPANLRPVVMTVPRVGYMARDLSALSEP